MDFIGTGVTPPASPILQGGFANLASFLVRLVTVIGGLFATWNFIAAGYKFMNAGEDPEAITKAWGSIWKSLIGLLLIVASFVFAAFIGWIFLGSPTAIIAPYFSTTPPVVAPITPPAGPTATPVPESIGVTKIYLQATPPSPNSPVGIRIVITGNINTGYSYKIEDQTGATTLNCNAITTSNTGNSSSMIPGSNPAFSVILQGHTAKLYTGGSCLGAVSATSTVQVTTTGGENTE